MDILASELGLWKSQGYFVSRVVPLDMFPGTCGLEVLVLLGKRF
jgi:tRNA/tmRNA/rRNA uracil-C5-methylase (TrmA/RlmC/RlmD family)